MMAVEDLGWANGWRETPAMVKKCQEEDHWRKGYVVEKRFGPPFRDFVSITTCRKCGYRYHSDSS